MTSFETKLLGSLLPANPVVADILNQIRTKYGIEEFDVADPAFADQLLNDPDLPWEEIAKELKTLFVNYPDFIPPEIMPYARHALNNPGKTPTLEEVKSAELTNYTEELGRQALLYLVIEKLPSFQAIADYIDFNVQYMLAFLLTGKTQPVPEKWFGGVYTEMSEGEPVIYVMATRLSDPKKLQKDFMTEYHRVFGKDRPKITEGVLNAAEFLRMRLEGMPIKDVADAYIQRHRSQFPKDPKSDEYRKAKRKLEERLKTALRRTEQTFQALIGGQKSE